MCRGQDTNLSLTNMAIQPTSCKALPASSQRQTCCSPHCRSPVKRAWQNLTVNTGHLVTHIETSGRKATGVVCQDLIGNTTRTYKGKIVVLAAGSLESPRVALQSTLNDPNQKIGVGLTDHPAFFSAQYNDS